MTDSTKTRLARTAAGLCSRCMKRRASKGHDHCQLCREAIRETVAAAYYRKRDLGLCTRAGCENKASGHLCEGCAELRRQRRRKG